MDLRLCPACGQSVLDDDAKTCPFCGGAMDGSGAGGKKPATPAKSGSAGSPSSSHPAPPPAGRPGLTRRSPSVPPTAPGKSTAAPSDSTSTSASAGAAQPGASSAPPGNRGGKPIVDEDDPFGLGPTIPAAEAIQALSKPEKGKLHKVICPMCDQPGFVAKSAIGKSIRCANPKCIVPVFTAPDPDAPPVDRIPRRRAIPDDDVQKKPEGSALRRNPMLMYGVVAVVLLALAAGLVQFLRAPVATPPGIGDSIPVPKGGYGNPTEEELEAAAAAAARKKAASLANSPAVEAERMVKRMIQAARQPTNRDKSFARRLTADIYLRLGQPDEAAQEFSQLVANDPKTTYYQIEPRLGDYWRRKQSGDKAGAAKQFAQILKDSATAPLGGRMALESAIGIAAALVAENQVAEAAAVVERYQRDRSIDARRDSMTTSAYFMTSFRLQEVGLVPFRVDNIFGWQDPLRTTVAVDLATHNLWSEAVRWSASGTDLQEKCDSLAAIAEIAVTAGTAPEVVRQIEDAAVAAHPMIGLRVRAVLAGALKDPARLDGLRPVFTGLAAPTAMALPKIAEVLHLNLPNTAEPTLTASAVCEVARAAVLCGDATTAEAAVRRLHAELAAIAPPTAQTRAAATEIESSEEAVKKRLANEMRLATDAQIVSNFRNYRRKIDQLSAAAEVRRLMLTLKLSRIVQAGGIQPVATVVADSATGLKTELMVDDLCGVLAAAAVHAGQDFAEFASPDASLRVPKPRRTADIPELTVRPKIAVGWLLASRGRLVDSVKVIEPGVDLPGLREAAIHELLMFQLRKSRDKPEAVYSAIGQIANAAWRETLLQSAGLLVTRGGGEKAAEVWIEAQTRMPATEQVTAYHGLAVGLTERISAPSARDAKAPPPARK